MFIQIHRPDKETKNAGSCHGLLQYLEKENVGKDLHEEEHFFSHDSDCVSSVTAELEIDLNRKGLKASESKFYMLTINPSEKELNYINNNPEALRQYTRSVMDEYAKNFERANGKRDLRGNDLVYFAKIEHFRRYDPLDKKFFETYQHNQKIRNEVLKLKKDLGFNENVPKEIQNRIDQLEKNYIRDAGDSVILPGINKPGLNTHIHVVVSRKDKSNKISLSPLANSRGSKNKLNGKEVQIGFDRMRFVANCEGRFDREFNYHRSPQESFSYKHAQKHDTAKFISFAITVPTNEKELARKLVMELFDKDKQIQRMISPVKKFPKTEKEFTKRLQEQAIDSVAKLIAGGANPTASVIKMVVQKTIDLGLSAGGISL